MNHLAKSVLGLLAGLAIAAVPMTVAAEDILLCIEDVRGESAVEDPAGCMDVASWSWGMERPESESGSTRTLARTEVGDLTIVKEADTASAELLLGMLRGKVYKTAVLLVRACPAGCAGEPAPLVTITVDNVSFTRLDMGGPAGERPTERLSLAFESLEYCYQQFGPDGSLGNEFCSQYSIEEGV